MFAFEVSYKLASKWIKVLFLRWNLYPSITLFSYLPYFDKTKDLYFLVKMAHQIKCAYLRLQIMFATKRQLKTTSLLLLAKARLRIFDSHTLSRWELLNDIGVMKCCCIKLFLYSLRLVDLIYVLCFLVIISHSIDC